MNKDKIGKKLRKVRKSSKTTIDELAKRAEVSPGLISQIERGKICPTVVTLWKILDALDTSIGDFLSDAEQKSNIVVRRNERKEINLSTSSALYELLTPDLQGELEFIKVTIAPGNRSYGDGMVTHEGEECVVVVEGQLKVKLGDDEYILNAGDSIRFKSSIPHLFINTGDVTSVSYWAMPPPSF